MARISREKKPKIYGSKQFSHPRFTRRGCRGLKWTHNYAWLLFTCRICLLISRVITRITRPATTPAPHTALPATTPTHPLPFSSQVWKFTNKFLLFSSRLIFIGFKNSLSPATRGFHSVFMLPVGRAARVESQIFDWALWLCFSPIKSLWLFDNLLSRHSLTCCTARKKFSLRLLASSMHRLVRSE